MGDKNFSNTTRAEKATITWDQSQQLYSDRFEDIYHSHPPSVSATEIQQLDSSENSLTIRHDTAVQNSPLEESRHVFLAGNHLETRWQTLTRTSFIIAELGFGSGLNFLLSWKLFNKCTHKHTSEPQRLHYIGIEKYPLRVSDLQRLHQQWPELNTFSDELLHQYCPHTIGQHRLYFDDGSVILDLCIGDAEEVLSQRDEHTNPAIDAWFMDGFSPSRNPEMWSHKLIQEVARNSRPGTTLSSYSVAAAVRTPLKSAGFVIEKAPGYGRKRHMLKARYEINNTDVSAKNQQSAREKRPPWFILPHRAALGPAPTVVVVGAGLAGCSSAYALAQRGFPVTVLEADLIASGASGNPQSALHLKASTSYNTESLLELQSYLFAARQFSYLKKTKNLNWQASGLIHLTTAMNRRKAISLERVLENYADEVLNAGDDIQRTAVNGKEFYYLPQSGWLNIGELCETYLKHPNITVHENEKVTTLKRLHDTADAWWSVQSKQNTYSAPVVIIANAAAAIDFEPFTQLPLNPVAGQVTQISTASMASILDEELVQAPQPIICGEKTFFPSYQHKHTLGSSYPNLYDKTASASPSVLNDTANQENLSGVAKVFKQLGQVDNAQSILTAKVVASRTSVRCSTPDRLPIVGLAADHKATQNTFKELARRGAGHHSMRTKRSTFYPNLFLNVAHGSHGLTTCPLAAEYLAAYINSENLPLRSAQIDLLSPVRFLSRSLKKSKRNNF